MHMLVFGELVISFKMPHLSEGDQQSIVALSTKSGWTQGALVQEYRVSQGSVSKWLTKCSRVGAVKDLSM